MAGTTFSFELYPPRSAPAKAALDVALPELVAAGPSFISVTYGASGTTRGVSLDVVRYLIEHTNVPPMAHFTAVGSSFAEASVLVREFLDAGVTSFLALRGDPPEGVQEDELVLGDFGSAGELVQFIHAVQTEREPFFAHDVPGFPGAKRLGSGRKVTIASSGRLAACPTISSKSSSDVGSAQCASSTTSSTGRRFVSPTICETSACNVAALRRCGLMSSTA